MPCIVALLFEDRIEESYIAIELEGEEPVILFTKGPDFVKTMGPYPVPYAEATFRKWGYCRVKNPPEVDLRDKGSIARALINISRLDGAAAYYRPQDT